jgi:deoxyribonuclease V
MASWEPRPDAVVAGVFVCFQRGGSGPGRVGDRGWAGAAMKKGRHTVIATTSGAAVSPYLPGLLALREGPLLESAVSALPVVPDILLVNATGRDHPRRAGLALHLGAKLHLPTVGVTHRPLVASGSWPDSTRGATSTLTIEGDLVGYWVRTVDGVRPLCVHAGWATTPESAVEIVLSVTGRVRTPEPLRRARTAARRARSGGISWSEHY